MTKSEYNTNYYQTLKTLHRCVRCGGQDARTLIGKPLCFDCCERKSEEMRGVDQSESRKRSREKAIANGICTHCYKRKTDGVHKTCNYCREEAKRKQNEPQLNQYELEEQRKFMEHHYQTCRCYNFIFDSVPFGDKLIQFVECRNCHERHNVNKFY